MDSSKTPRKPRSSTGSDPSDISLIYVQETIVDLGEAPKQDVDPGYGECLSETKTHQSDNWRKHKADAQKLATNLNRAKGFEYAGSVARCATELNLYQYPDSDTLKVRPWQTCKKRWCPVCSWVKSQKRWLLASERIPGLIDQVGEPLRWRLLTLTVRNCSGDDLRTLTREMLKAFRRMTQHDSWDALGWIRALEVTHNPDAATFHPHIHCLMAGPAMNPRIEQADWVAKWQKAMKLPYPPVVDVRAVNKRPGAGKFSDALGGLQEVAKYTLKPANLKEASAVDLVAAIEGLSGLRLSEGGGFLRGVFAEKSDEELAGLEEETGKARGVFDWRVKSQNFRRRLGD
jgi:plasmid rolling circle replication initiator protein Rep